MGGVFTTGILFVYYVNPSLLEWERDVLYQHADNSANDLPCALPHPLPIFMKSLIQLIESFHS